MMNELGISSEPLRKGGITMEQALKGVPSPNFEPHEDRVMIIPILKDEKTAGGIIIPDSVREELHLGLIVAVGPEAIDDHPHSKAQVGQFVRYGKYAGADCEVDGLPYVIFRAPDILGFYDPAQNEEYAKIIEKLAHGAV